MRSEVGFIAAALLLHAALPLAARIAPRAEVSGLAFEAIVAIDVSEPPPEAPATNEARDRAEPADPEAATRPLVASADRVSVAPREGRAPAEIEPPINVPPPTGTTAPRADEYGPDDGVVRALPGFGGPSVYTIPGVLPQAAAPAPAPTTPDLPRAANKDAGGQAVRDAMRTKDKALGLDLPAAGTVASSVADAVRISDTPATSKATFEVRLGPGGNVLGVRVVNSNGGSSDMWERAARAAAAKLSGRTLAMPSDFAKGATVYVDVSSSQDRPTGSGGPIKPSGSGFGFDLSDIGAHKQRVVRSSFRVVATR